MRANRQVSRRETAFRHALWRQGARGYRLHHSLPGRPDIAFPALRLAVFINGCFWHVCPTCRPPQPRANAAFWRDKLAANVERDVRVHQALQEANWEVLVVWEHEIRPDPIPRAALLADYITQLRKARMGTAEAAMGGSGGASATAESTQVRPRRAQAPPRDA
jgi:DNA mismatch endonuclease (patch repair protein)